MNEQEAARALQVGAGLELKGRPERIKEFRKGLETAASALEEIQEYREIGTIEECQEARELQEPAEPQEVLSAGGRGVYQCKNCGNELYVNSFSGVYCHWCGKKLKWGDKP